VVSAHHPFSPWTSTNCLLGDVLIPAPICSLSPYNALITYVSGSGEGAQSLQNCPCTQRASCLVGGQIWNQSLKVRIKVILRSEGDERREERYSVLRQAVSNQGNRSYSVFKQHLMRD
jgi:hypothetical protein